MQLTPENTPVVGEGRPTFPLQLVKDKPLARAMKARGMAAIQELKDLEASGARNDAKNPQKILYRFKIDAMKLARKREKEVIPALLADIRDREKALKLVKADTVRAEQDRLAEAAALTTQICQLKQRRYRQQQQNSRATHRLYGDRPTKYWSKLHRECAPRDIIPSFEREDIRGVSGEKIYVSDSIKMAAMARTHHMNVQRDDEQVKSAEERETDIIAALNSLDAEVTEEQATELGDEITYEEILLSLRFSKNGSSPGLDGLPFEFWKTLNARYVEDSRFPERMAFDVVLLLRTAFEDINKHGVDEHTSLARGWIAPIYKEKGERTRVVNYRPITLLNTDYKLLSKTLAICLANVAPGIIHKAQAGFVPGRKIHNHTQLARMMMYWAERNGANGAVVALDQEKAYDRIAHDYLWRVLERFKFPESLIRLIKSLYSKAETSIMINGILSKPYRIYRGVRQGDPLSCLLFDLAIEPLSAMIRNSAIEGYKIPRCEEILKAVLFADDTTIYLSEDDDFQTLQDVLDVWCSAAKARFDIGKTEIIPIGDPTFRREMAETYRTTGTWKNYPRGVHVAQEGEAVRILGAFFGNEINQIDVWSLVLTKIVAMRKPLMQVISHWQEGHATIQGKKHVIQMIVAGMTQYLTSVQRMPDHILARLTKIIRGYLWDDRHNTPVGMEHVCLPISQGGLGMMDLEARNEAIDVMWLKAYLDYSSERPLWAFLVDDLFATHVPKDARPREVELRINTFLQRWKPRANGHPEELKGMMTVARKYGLRPEGLAMSRDILQAMPMWDHVYADRTKLGRLTIPSKLLTCLRTTHGARTVGDFLQIARAQEVPAHRPRATCRCAECVSLRARSGCANPHLCSARAKEMLATLPTKWDPRGEQPEDYEGAIMDDVGKEGLDQGDVPFDRRVTTYGDLGQALRIFTSDEPVSNVSLETRIREDGTGLTIATDGSCTHNGERRARAGAGIYAEEQPRLNLSFKLPDRLEQSNQTGEIVATMLASTAADDRTRVCQETDSRTTMESLTKWRQAHEDSGYITQRNSALTQVTVAKLRLRKAHTIFRWVKGHSNHPRNDAADALAAVSAAKPSGDTLDLVIPPQMRVTGAKLQKMTQRLAYLAIRARKDTKTVPRPSAVANLDRIATGIEAAYGTPLHDATIWTSLRTRHVSRAAAQYMWMAVHNGYMIGHHWLRPGMSDELQARATCSACGERETMTHIIFECMAMGQETLWKLLEQTWSLTGAVWHEPSWGTTFGAACAVFTDTAGRRQTATENLWCILCTETLHLVWKLRCERVIRNEGAEFTEQEITNRYYATVQSRLELDRRTAAQVRGKRGLKPQDVARIWTPVLEGGRDLPPKWVTNSGVLVGIKRGR